MYYNVWSYIGKYNTQNNMKNMIYFDNTVEDCVPSFCEANLFSFDESEYTLF